MLTFYGFIYHFIWCINQISMMYIHNNGLLKKHSSSKPWITMMSELRHCKEFHKKIRMVKTMWFYKQWNRKKYQSVAEILLFQIFTSSGVHKIQHGCQNERSINAQLQCIFNPFVHVCHSLHCIRFYNFLSTCPLTICPGAAFDSIF